MENGRGWAEKRVNNETIEKYVHEMARGLEAMECNLHFHYYTSCLCLWTREESLQNNSKFPGGCTQRANIPVFSVGEKFIIICSSSSSGFNGSSRASQEWAADEGRKQWRKERRARALQQLNCWDNVVNNFQVEIISFRWAANGATELLWWNCTSTLESRIFLGSWNFLVLFFGVFFSFSLLFTIDMAAADVVSNSKTFQLN